MEGESWWLFLDGFKTFGFSLTESLDGLSFGGLGLEDALGFTFGSKDLGLLLGFGVEDEGLLLTFGDENSGLFLTFGKEDLLTFLTLSSHLTFHGVSDVLRWENVLNFDAVDFDAPWIGGGIEDLSHLLIDDVSGSEGLVEVEITDDVTKGGRGEVFDSGDWIIDAVSVELWIGDLVEGDGVDLHGDVIFGDDALWVEVSDLFLHVDGVGDFIEEWDEHMDANSPSGVVGAHSLNDVLIGLLDDLDVADDDDQENEENDRKYK